MSYVLAIDFGTSFTCAALARDGRAEMLRFGGDAHFPSHVFLEEDGTLLAGRAAGNGAARAPDRYERSPKRQLGFAGMVLGEAEIDPRDAVAAVLREVLDAALRHQNGRDPAQVRLTHPAAWGPRRLEALREAARRAGMPNVVLVSEPEAAAHHFANARVRVGGTQRPLRPGDLLAVYDLGGGTFDTAVLRCTGPDQFELVGPPGGTAGPDEDVPEIGGDAFDRELYEYLGSQVAARDAAAWHAIERPTDRRDRQAQRLLREDAREAKENLSSTTTTHVWVDRIGEDLLVTREQFNAMINAAVKATLAILDDTLAGAGVSADQVAALFLTGGSSRIPLVSDSVERHFGSINTQDDPKTIVALGAAAMREGGAPAPPPAPPRRKSPDQKRYPAELGYDRSHHWVVAEGDLVTIGLTWWAQDQLGALTDIALSGTGWRVQRGSAYGAAAGQELLAPATGTVVAVNDVVKTRPGLINDEPYGAGWLVKLRVSDPSELGALMDAPDYVASLPKPVKPKPKPKPAPEPVVPKPPPPTPRTSGQLENRRLSWEIWAKQQKWYPIGASPFVSIAVLAIESSIAQSNGGEQAGGVFGISVLIGVILLGVILGFAIQAMLLSIISSRIERLGDKPGWTRLGGG